jgi:hypothetical protein
VGRAVVLVDWDGRQSQKSAKMQGLRSEIPQKSTISNNLFNREISESTSRLFYFMYARKTD